MNAKNKIRRMCGCCTCHPTAIHFAMLSAIALVVGGVLICKKKACHKKKGARAQDACTCDGNDSITKVVVREIYPDPADSAE